jgi:hypothetical protein
MDDDALEKITAALRAVPDPEKVKVLADALVDLPPDLLLCLFPIPTSTELDMKSIMNRTRITATVTPASGTVINVGENFALDVTVMNCTTHNLRGTQLVARATTFASVVGSNVAALGDMTPGQTRSAAFQCLALAPVSNTGLGGAEGGGTTTNPMINLSVSAVLDFRGRRSLPVGGNIVAN